MHVCNFFHTYPNMFSVFYMWRQRDRTGRGGRLEDQEIEKGNQEKEKRYREYIPVMFSYNISEQTYATLSTSNGLSILVDGCDEEGPASVVGDSN